MPIDPERLARFDTRSYPPLTGSARTVRGLHRLPEVAGRIPLEALALAPVPTLRQGSWHIVNLLVVPVHPSAVPAAVSNVGANYRAPQTVIEWTWPDPRLTDVRDLRQSPDARQLAARSPIFSARPTALPAPLSSIQQTQRENVLFQALDAALAATPTEEAQRRLDALAPLYAALLPAEVYPFYWLVAPDSARWLRPDATGDPTYVPTVQQTGATDTLPASALPTTLPNTVPGTTADLSATTPAYDIHNPVTGPDDPTIITRRITAEDLEKPPRDLTSLLGPWMTRTLGLAQRAQASEILDNLRALDARRQLPGFRLAFVGEFNRGKSTLINRLLGRKILPVGVTPTTATITSIVAGASEQMQVLSPNGPAQTRPLEAAAWADITARGDQALTGNAAYPWVRVTVDNPWLRGLGMELLDTPGAGDLNENRTALVFDALSQSDAAIFLVSALAPFSLTERAFLQQEVLGRRVAPVGVVLTHLDEVPAEERANVLRTAVARVGQVAPSVPILPSHSLGAGDGAVELERIRQLIDGLAHASDRQAWRSQQIAGRLADALAQIATVGEAAAAAARLSEAQRDTALQRSREAERDTATRWQSIRVDLDQRRLSLEGELRRRIESAREELLRTLAHDLRRTGNPKVWWEEDLPFYLYRELGQIGRSCESTLMSALARDLQWLQTTAAGLGGNLVRQLIPSGDDLPAAVVVGAPALQLHDTQHLRLYSRVGSGAATVATYFLFGPVGIAVSVGSGLVSEQVINKQVEAQREVVQRHLESAVSDSLDAYVRGILQRLHAFYDEAALELRQAQAATVHGVSAALAASPVASQEPGWRALAAEAITLRTEITNALS